MGDAFTRDRFVWLNQVFADHELVSQAFKLAFAISEHINRQTKEAWPTQQTLATEIGCSDRTVRTLIERLRDRGHLEYDTRRGRHIPNVYRLVFKNRKLASDITEPENRKLTSGILEPKPEAQFHLEGEKTGSPAHENRKTASKKPEAHFLQNPLKNPLREPTERESLSDRFAEFWEAYPRHVAKEAARRAYRSVMKKCLATEDEIIAGTKRYAEERRGEPSRYTKHPATWLNGGCWADEPSSAQPLPSPKGRDRPNVFDGILSYDNNPESEQP